MLRQLSDVKNMIEKKYGYAVSHSRDDKTKHELLQASLSVGEIPFMTFSYSKDRDCILVNTELQFPDTFTIAEITLECMKMYNTEMGKAFLVIFLDDGGHDVLYEREAYDYIAQKMLAAEDAQSFEEDSQYFVSKKDKATKGSGNVH
jgi:hypothetical protein